MTTLRVNTAVPQQLFERDWRGETIYPNDAATINVCIANELSLGKEKLSFHVVVKIEKASLASERDADGLAIAWLKQTLPERMSRAPYWDFFSYTWLVPDAVPPAPDVSPYYAQETEIDLTPRLREIADAGAAHVAAIRVVFEAAKAELWVMATNNAPLGFAQTVGQARSLLRTIESVLSCSADIGGYEPSKARYAMRDYEDLARRKQETNHNYQYALSSLKSFAHGVAFPSTWHRRPEA
ncbi:hypothetical protein J7E70_29405 [Variovorax paradoxus]|nr:hypothetical protein [Variovorax paradoxus]MBT2304548.1 hypothetical protein [Variovorax paradoxus]